MSNTEDNLTFWDHLDELRSTLMRIIGVTALFGIVAFCFKDWLFEVVLAPTESDFVTYRLLDRLGVMFGSPETTTGGNALKFYSSVRIDIRRIGQIKDGEEVLGNQTRVKVVKNKVAPPFRKAEFEILFGQGISKIGELVDLGVQYGIVRKSGAWFSYEESKIGQGREAAKRTLADNPELAEEIEAKIFAAMRESNDK